MAPLLPLPLPLCSNKPPSGFERDADGCSFSQSSATSVFATKLDSRDTFLGRPRCVVCGQANEARLRHCYIVPASERLTWRDLQRRGWVPEKAKRFGKHEPRNGLLMCATHRSLFQNHKFFVRYIPQTRKFVLIDFSGDADPDLVPYHGKAIGLDIQDRYAPFPTLFIIHEMRVRGLHPFVSSNPSIPDDIPWQDWIVEEGVLRSESDDLGLFNRSQLHL